MFLDIHNLHNIMLLYYVGSDHKVKRSHKKKLATAAPSISSMLQICNDLLLHHNMMS